MEGLKFDTSISTSSLPDPEKMSNRKHLFSEKGKGGFGRRFRSILGLGCPEGLELPLNEL